MSQIAKSKTEFTEKSARSVTLRFGIPSRDAAFVSR